MSVRLSVTVNGATCEETFDPSREYDTSNEGAVEAIIRWRAAALAVEAHRLSLEPTGPGNYLTLDDEDEPIPQP